MFETEGDGKWPGFWWEEPGGKKPNGRRWQGNPKLLRDTGILVGSITPDWDDESAEAFTNVPYAKYHVSQAPRSVIPLRDFFAFDRDAFEGDVADMILLRLDRDVAAE
jgi:phage gpG-like protein